MGDGVAVGAGVAAGCGVAVGCGVGVASGSPHADAKAKAATAIVTRIPVVKPRIRHVVIGRSRLLSGCADMLIGQPNARNMVGDRGLEPLASAMSTLRSNQLS